MFGRKTDPGTLKVYKIFQNLKRCWYHPNGNIKCKPVNKHVYPSSPFCLLKDNSVRIYDPNWNAIKPIWGSFDAYGALYTPQRGLTVKCRRQNLPLPGNTHQNNQIFTGWYIKNNALMKIYSKVNRLSSIRVKTKLLENYFVWLLTLFPLYSP